jgi:hypothetical protein
MTSKDWIMLATALYVALIALLLFANWHRKRLLKWALAETRWIELESNELQIMRKHLVQQFTWDSTRGYHGNLVMNAAFEARRKEYERRRKQLLEVTEKLPKLLPW